MAADMDLDKVIEDATKLKPIRVLLVCVGVVPFVLLLVLRFAWLALAFLIAAGKKGWELGGTKIEQWQAQAREAREAARR